MKTCELSRSMPIKGEIPMETILVEIYIISSHENLFWLRVVLTLLQKIKFNQSFEHHC
jgi:hypothetical protein